MALKRQATRYQDNCSYKERANEVILSWEINKTETLTTMGSALTGLESCTAEIIIRTTEERGLELTNNYLLEVHGTVSGRKRERICWMIYENMHGIISVLRGMICWIRHSRWSSIFRQTSLPIMSTAWIYTTNKIKMGFDKCLVGGTWYLGDSSLQHTWRNWGGANTGWRHYTVGLPDAPSAIQRE